MSLNDLESLFEKYAQDPTQVSKGIAKNEKEILVLFDKYSNVYPNNLEDLQKLFEKFSKIPKSITKKRKKRRGRPCKKDVDDPRAFGICPNKELLGQKRKGKDGKFWTVVRYGKKTERYKWVPVRKIGQVKRSKKKTPRPGKKNQWVRFVTSFHRERKLQDPEYTLKQAYTDARKPYQEYKSTLKTLQGGDPAQTPTKTGGSVYLDILQEIRKEHPNLREKEKRKLAKQQYHELKE